MYLEMSPELPSLTTVLRKELKRSTLDKVSKNKSLSNYEQKRLKVSNKSKLAIDKENARPGFQGT